MASLVRVPPDSPESVRIDAGFSGSSCWKQPLGMRERTLRKARRNGLDTSP